MPDEGHGVGAHVVFGDVLAAPGRAVAEETGATFVDHDVSSEPAWAEVVSVALAQHGRIDGLVNNAGILAGPAATVAGRLRRFSARRAWPSWSVGSAPLAW